MKKEEKSNAIFTDCLCFESFLSVGIIQALNSDWYYTSESKIFLFSKKIFSKYFSVNFKRLDYKSYADIPSGEGSLYEKIQEQTKVSIRELLMFKEIDSKNNQFTEGLKLNKSKLNLYLTVHYFPYVYRLTEIKALANLHSLNETKILLLKSPITFYTSVLNDLDILNYRMIFSHFLGINIRENYFYDYSHQMKPYFKSRRIFFLKEIIKKIFLISHVISFKGLKDKPVDVKFLGVELLQRRINPKATNDLFFLDNQELKDSDCCLIEQTIFTSHYKKDSYDEIDSRNFSRLKFFNYHTFIKQKKMRMIDRNYETFLFLRIINARVFFTKIFSLIFYIFTISSIEKLHSFLLEKYDLDSFIWSEIYGKFNISVVWTMLDGGYQQVIRSQAIERNKGLYCGSHWSNYPMVIVYNYKPYDVVFPWSKHFKYLSQKEFQHLQSHEVGYVSTDYFKYHRSSASDLREEYPGKFIITFNDNVFHNDIAISESNYDDFYALAMRLIEDNEDIIVFIKPKRVSLFHKKVKSFTKLQNYLASGRARLFSPEDERSKITPAELAMASDLVIGLGTSTTTLESFIAGTPAINLNQCKFSNNEFSSKGMNNVVFDNLKSIVAQIENHRSNSKEKMLKEQEKFYRILDPFMDESSGNRVAQKLKNILNRKSNLDTLQ